ncbi:gluconate kinase [Paenibacillus psychroresistens]|uniref:Gluconate kinase n=1 Tax=Paenibacillus psychroresistens TaxID=1778678 RepID=A0A6B8RIA6_9BACL|nr:FGGY family carbohydrate kinase [Paenibacillus psychroresistens]QGQ95292.1 gluconate kinase [Paenibacillus psychroresistens]
MQAVEKKYVVAVDIGTTSTKTLLVERSGSIRAEHSIGYGIISELPGRAEQNPAEIYEAVIAGIREVIASSRVQANEILCVSFSSAMHSLIAIDAQFNPLTQSIIWADSRAVLQADRLKKSTEGHEVYLRTGTPLHPMSPLTKLMWLKENEFVIFAKTAWFVGIKDYILAKLFGRVVMDYSIASGTGLFNLAALAWDAEAMRIAGVSADRLPEPVPTTYRLLGLDASEAKRMGIELDTPFVVGAADGVLANLGVGAYEPGIFSVSVGTSGAVRTVVSKPIADPKGRLFCYALTENAWVVGGAINNGGILFRWVRDVLATEEAAEARRQGLDPYDYLAALAEKVPAGSEGLLMLPMLTGERAPHWNANARGVFFGLSLTHGKAHMIRSVLEGVVYGLYSVAAALTEVVGPGKEIRASGGFARSIFWRQIMTDVWGMPLVVPDVIESSGLGAAYLGLIAMGEVSDFSGVQAWIQTGTAHTVDIGNNKVYGQLFPLYEQVYDRLKDSFDDIARFQNGE